jgi:chemotaxis signal transduction protein
MSAGILYCDVGADRFAFHSRDVRHVERAEHLRPAAADDGRAGVLMLGDLAVQVFPLGAALGLAGDRSAGTIDRHIAVTGDRHSLVGWLVDRVARADQSGAFQVAPMPPLVGSPASMWFEGAVRTDADRSALLIRPEGLRPYAVAPAPRFQLPAGAASPPEGTREPVAVVFMTDALPRSTSRRYALSGRQIAAIVQAEAPIELPGCADHVMGVIWWRNAIVPVIDFRNPADRHVDPRGRRLIARCGPRHHGALVAISIAAEVLMCRADGSHREMPEVQCPWFASGVFDINGEPVALLDLDVLLDCDASASRHGDAVLPDLLVEGAAGDAEPLGSPLDPPAFGA